jgi:hypothetical protein
MDGLRSGGIEEKHAKIGTTIASSIDGQVVKLPQSLVTQLILEAHQSALIFQLVRTCLVQHTHNIEKFSICTYLVT